MPSLRYLQPDWDQHQVLTKEEERCLLLIYLKDTLDTIPERVINMFIHECLACKHDDECVLTPRGIHVAERVLLIEAARITVRQAWGI